MRKFKSILTAVLIAVATVLPPTALMLAAGCGTPAAKTTQAAGSVTITVESAMLAWGDWVRANKATVEQRVQVRAAYQKYQASMLVAEKVALSVLSAPENQSVYVAALNAASQASIELIALIETFTRKQ